MLDMRAVTACVWIPMICELSLFGFTHFTKLIDFKLIL